MSAMTADELDARLHPIVVMVGSPVLQREPPALYFLADMRVAFAHYGEGLKTSPRPVRLWHIARVFRRVALGRLPA